MVLVLKIEISQIRGHRRRVLLSFEAETPEDAVVGINRFLLKKFPETFEKIYGIKAEATEYA
jgi:hypothetical protein